MNVIYKLYLNNIYNFFVPQLKLVEKVRLGLVIIKMIARLLASLFFIFNAIGLVYIITNYEKANYLNMHFVSI